MVRIQWIGAAFCAALAVSNAGVVDAAPLDGKATVAQLAQRAGLSQFATVSDLRFSFHVKRPGKESVRKWQWNVISGDVIWENHAINGVEQSVLFLHRTGIALTQTEQEYDHAFVNDSYWLLFPLQLAWDKNPSFTRIARQTAPISGLTLDVLKIQYTATGYSPGDAYELFLLPERSGETVAEWRYTSAAGKILVSTWERPVKLGSLSVYTYFAHPKEGFEVWFTDLGVRLKGQSEWLTPSTSTTPKLP